MPHTTTASAHVPENPTGTRKGMKASWENLPKRKCDNCGATYKPARPLRSIDRYGFCKPDCKKSFHKNGGAYRKLKGEIEKLVTREVARRMSLEEPCDYCQGKGAVHGNGRPAGPKQPSYRCPKCINGAVVTPFGREVIDFMQRRFSGTPHA